MAISIWETYKIMGFKIIRFKQKEQTQWGVVNNEKIYPLQGNYPLLADLIKRGLPEAKNLAIERNVKALDVDTTEILNPVTAPCQIICQGKNYSDHRIETGASPQRPDFNLLFSKASSSLAPPNGQVVCPSHVNLLDYELELGLVIGKDILDPQKITPDNLGEFICGIVMANDISARDVQIPQGQWFKGKSFRTFCPAGPYLYIIENSDVDRLNDLQLSLKVNGELRQNSNTRDLLFQPAETMDEISKIMDLRAGDLILTGTPGGVALKAPGGIVQKLATAFLSEQTRMKLFLQNQVKNPRYLKNGDVIEATIRSSDGEIDLGAQTLKVIKTV
jgi:2-keto-4-pentenoate hydratase/2-oxohepta-3-ene-1,7-dioic acid hydratase in catechol pathway